MRKDLRADLILALTALVLASLACQSVGGGGPSASTEEVPGGGTSEPIAEIPTFSIDSEPTEEENSSTGGSYDGDWVGKNTNDDKDILFSVENNQVATMSLNYTGETSGCTYHGAASVYIDPVTIEDGSFTIVYSSINDELTFAGTFTSDREASGTLHIKSSAEGLCGEYEKDINWTATKGTTSALEPEATEESGGLLSDNDAVAVVTGFFDAVNAGDVNSAVAMVDEGIMFSIGSETLFDQAELKSYLQDNKGLTFEISDTQSLGGAIVQFKAKASDGKVYSSCQAFLLDGKISMVTMTP